MKINNRRHTSSISTVAVPFRDVGVKLMFLLLISLSFVLIVLSRVEHPAVIKLRAALTDITVPVVSLLAQPAHSVQQMMDSASGWALAHQINGQLAAENEQLKQWRIVASELEAENQALRHLLNLAPVGETHFISGRVVSNLSNPYTQSPLLSIGRENGVKLGMAAITGDGMVGRIIESGEHSARILPVTDINSRISVITEQSRERAIAAGRNRATLELHYLPEKSRLNVGERIITSGDGNLLPAGLPVGIVTEVENGHAEVTPLVDWSRLDYLSLVSVSQPSTK